MERDELQTTFAIHYIAEEGDSWSEVFRAIADDMDKEPGVEPLGVVIGVEGYDKTPGAVVFYQE